MKAIDGLPVDAGRDDKLKKTEPEDGLYDVVDDQKVSSRRELSVVHPATEQLAAVPYVRHPFLNKAISDAQNAFLGWGAVPFERRKAILSSSLNKIVEDTNELSALLAAEQGGLLAEARWEIDLLTKAFGPALMQMEPSERKQEKQRLKHVTERYLPTTGGGCLHLRNLPVILSFGKVLPALLTGDTVVLRPFSSTPLTLLRISEYLGDLLPPGVFSVVIEGHDHWPWMTSDSGIDLITFTKSANLGRPALGSAAGTLEPVTLELGGSGSSAVSNHGPERSALFGSLMLVPVTWKPGRHGLARTLFEILSFRPVRMRTQVLVWSLARKASYTFPIFR